MLTLRINSTKRRKHNMQKFCIFLGNSREPLNVHYDASVPDDDLLALQDFILINKKTPFFTMFDEDEYFTSVKTLPFTINGKKWMFKAHNLTRDEVEEDDDVTILISLVDLIVERIE